MKIPLILILLFLIISCTKNEQIDSEAPIIIELDKVHKNEKSNRKFNDYFDILNVVELETNEKSMLAAIDKLIFKEDKIIVFDNNSTGLKVFNRSGKYLYDISKLGQGPGEFTKIFDFAIKDSSLLIYSNNDMKIAEFNLKGDFIRDSKIPFYSSYFTSNNKYFYFFLNYNTSQYNNKKNLLITDHKFNIIKGLFPYKRHYATSFTGNLINSNNNILYNDAYDGNIYKLENENAKLIYTVKLGKRELPIELTNTEHVPNIDITLYDFFGKVKSYSNQLFTFTAKMGDYFNNCIYIRKKDEVLLKKSFIKNDVYHILSAPEVYSEKDSIYYSIITPVTLGYIKYNPNFFEELKVYYPTLFPVLNKLTYLSNPIIVFYKLR